MMDLAATLRAEVDRAAGSLRRIGETEASRGRGDGKWVKKEILGHLIDSAVNNHQRFVRAQSENPFTGPGYDQKTWVTLNQYRERPWAELVSLWVALNQHVAIVIEGVPAEKLETVCQIADLPPASLDWLMRDYLTHMKHHLEQLEGK